jgi:PAS domain S-box-containing protein
MAVDVTNGGTRLLRISVTTGILYLAEEKYILNIKVLGAALALTVGLGVLLWFTQRWVAIAPLESAIESTERDREALEAMVSERTLELRESNTILEDRIGGHERALRDLRESESRYRTLAENLPDIVYRAHVVGDRGMEFLNDRITDLTGYLPEELSEGRFCSIEPLIVGEDIRRVLRTVETAVAEDRPFQVEYRLRHKNGEVRHMLERGRPVRDRRGETAYIEGVIIDITELRRSEEERGRMTHALAAIVDHMPEGVVLLNERREIEVANAMGMEYIAAIEGEGRAPAVETIAGRPIEDYLVSPPQVLSHEVAVGERVFRVAARRIGAGENGGGIVLVLADATEESRIKERLAARERLASLGQLASGVAHDFNNTLTCVIGFSEMMLLDARCPEHMRPQLEAVLTSGERARELVARMLDFTRSSASDPQIFDLGPFLDEFTMFIGRALPDAVELQVRRAPGVHPVRADRTKMQQVLANLAVNARDAMPRGGRIVVSLGRIAPVAGHPPVAEMPDGSWIVLSVEDTGEGMAEDVRARIFEPFFTTKDVGKGTGLGLAQVWGIVKQHEGFIDVRSAPGRGTTFTLYFPEAEAGAASSPHPVRETAMAHGHGETVLVVEDNGTVRTLLRGVLTTAGYRVLSAAGGAEALGLLEEADPPPVLLVTDIMMPGMDGMELARRARRKMPGLRVLGVTGYVGSIGPDSLAEAGIDRIVQKPFEPTALTRAVHSLLTDKA